jgi:2-polyprenyl-3-methyl-5-hydroxy-6-metoxy-1,4-benzoquinol methylase
LNSVRGSPEESLKRKGWTPETTSTIVKCLDCGCNYVRDVIPEVKKDNLSERSSKELRTEAIEKFKQGHESSRTYKRYPINDAAHWLIRNLCLLAANKQRRDIRVLDFGAGPGQMSNLIKACGVRDVIAYDPFFSDTMQEKYDAANFPGIICVSSAAKMENYGPYDAVIFQSAVEHVVDPRSELQLIFDNMSQGGYLYVNNPVMDLDVELSELKSSQKIVKGELISHYHPGHLNYMMPKQFEGLLKEIGFKILPNVYYFPPASPGAGMLGRQINSMVKKSIRWIQNLFGLPYKRYSYILQKP